MTSGDVAPEKVSRVQKALDFLNRVCEDLDGFPDEDPTPDAEA